MSKVKWIKVAINMCDDEKIKLIDAMDERDTIHYVWIRLLIQAGKTNAAGKIFLNENIPYSNEMLSIIFNRPIEIVEFALKTLINLKMIEIDESNFINISNWEKHQNIEGMDKIREQTKKRVERYREKNKLKEDSDTKNNCENNSLKNCNVTVTVQNKKEKEKEIKTKTKIEKENTTDSDNKIESDIMQHVKKISSKFVGVSLSSIKLAVSIHGEKNVKLAIDEAAKVNIPTMNYINGILKNWQRDGYPGNDSNSLNRDSKYKQKSHKVLSFNNFEPRQYDYDSLEKALLGW